MIWLTIGVVILWRVLAALANRAARRRDRDLAMRHITGAEPWWGKR